MIVLLGNFQITFAYIDFLENLKTVGMNMQFIKLRLMVQSLANCCCFLAGYSHTLTLTFVLGFRFGLRVRVRFRPIVTFHSLI